MTKEKLKPGWETVWGIRLSATLAICILLLYLFPASQTDRSGTRDIVTLNAFADPLMGLCFLLGVSCVVVWIFGMLNKKLWWAVPMWLGLCINPIALAPKFIDLIDPLNDYATFIDTDNSEYHLLMSHFLQGTTVLLTKRIGGFGPIRKFEILAHSPWEDSFGYLLVVRPPEAQPAPTIYRSPNGILIGVPYANHGMLAYDMNSQISYGQTGDIKHVRELSPFVLIGSKDKPSEGDFIDLMKLDSFCVPEAKIIEPELKNPNPRIREMAAALLKNMKDHPSIHPYP